LQHGATLGPANSTGEGGFALRRRISATLLRCAIPARRSLVRKGGFGYITLMRNRRTTPILEAKGLALGLRLGLSSPWAL
jgi:hypothetical protein